VRLPLADVAEVNVPVVTYVGQLPPLREKELPLMGMAAKYSKKPEHPMLKPKESGCICVPPLLTVKL
jgi:hypothetical protein